MSIIKLALKQLQNKIDLLQGPLASNKRRLESSPEECSCSVGKKIARECDAYFFGLLVQELRKKNINPLALPTMEAVKKSPHELCGVLEKVHDAIEARVAENVSRFPGHDDCNPLGPVITVLKEKRDTSVMKLNDKQTDHFQKLAAKMEPKE